MLVEKWQLFLSKLRGFGLYGLPLSAILVTAYALLWGQRQTTFRVARVYGGPTEGVTELALRVHAFATDSARLNWIEPLRGDIEVHARLADGRESRTRATLDAGVAEVTLEFASGVIRGPVTLAIQAASDGVELLQGRMQLGAAEWSRAATRQGGWLTPVSHGAIGLRVALENGVLAVPFAGTLLVQVVEPSPAPIEVEIEGEGVEISGAHTLRRQIPSAAPRTLRLPIVALEHAATLVIRARSGDGDEAEWHLALPVVPGALSVTPGTGGLVIRSPIPRDVAYLSIVDETQRRSGHVVQLSPTSDGMAQGFVPFTAPSAPLWAVVSSELDDQAPSLVGWPLPTLAVSEPVVPRTTFDVRDVLLLDGLDDALALRTRALRRTSRGAAGYCLVAGCLCAFLVARLWRRPRMLADDALASFTVQSRAETPWVAAFCVLLGFSLLAVFVLSRV